MAKDNRRFKRSAMKAVVPVKKVTVTEFCERVQVHGLVDWHRAESTCSKIFWLSAIIVFFVVLIYGVVGSVREYYTNPIQTSISITPNESLKFPMITICLTDFIDHRRLAQTEGRREILDPHLRNKPVKNLLKDTASMWNKLLPQRTYLQEPGMKKGTTLRQYQHYLKSVSFQKHEILTECEFEGYPFECRDFSETVLDKEHGTCYRLHLPQPQRFPGLGMRVVVDLNIDINGEVPRPFEGAFLAVSYEDEPFSMRKSLAAPGTYVKLDMELRHEQLINVEHSTTPQRCIGVESSKNNHGYKVLKGPYSQETCEADCLVFAALEKCGCIPLLDVSYVQDKFDRKHVCNDTAVENCVVKLYEKAGRNISACRSKCEKRCDSWVLRFDQSWLSLGSSADIEALQPKEDLSDEVNDTEVSSVRNRQRRPGGVAKKIPKKDTNYWRRNLILLDVAFGKLQFTSVAQNRAKTVLELLSDIGGQTELWLGCSIFTIIQIVVLTPGCFCMRRGRDRPEVV